MVEIIKGINFFWKKHRERQLSGKEFLLVCYWWIKNKQNREQITVKVIKAKL